MSVSELIIAAGTRRPFDARPGYPGRESVTELFGSSSGSTLPLFVLISSLVLVLTIPMTEPDSSQARTCTSVVADPRVPLTETDSYLARTCTAMDAGFHILLGAVSHFLGWSRSTLVRRATRFVQTREARLASLAWAVPAAADGCDLGFQRRACLRAAYGTGATMAIPASLDEGATMAIPASLSEGAPMAMPATTRASTLMPTLRGCGSALISLDEDAPMALPASLDKGATMALPAPQHAGAPMAIPAQWDAGASMAMLVSLNEGEPEPTPAEDAL